MKLNSNSPNGYRNPVSVSTIAASQGSAIDSLADAYRSPASVREIPGTWDNSPISLLCQRMHDHRAGHRCGWSNEQGVQDFARSKRAHAGGASSRVPRALNCPPSRAIKAKGPDYSRAFLIVVL